MEMMPTPKKSHSSAAVTAVVIVLCIAVLGGGFFIWKKKSREQVEELQRQLESLQNEESGLQDESAGLGEEAPVPESIEDSKKCFSSGVESVATVPGSTWYLNRNLHTGYQYKTAEYMIVSRDSAREENGIEVFFIGTKKYPELATLKAYDIHKRQYAYTGDSGVIVSYDAASDRWQKTFSGASATACVAEKFMTTAGNLPVYMIDPVSGARTYLVLAKIDPAKTGATAFLLEISFNIKNPDLPESFLNDLEGFIQSFERIGGQYPY